MGEYSSRFLGMLIAVLEIESLLQRLMRGSEKSVGIIYSAHHRYKLTPSVITEVWVPRFLIILVS